MQNTVSNVAESTRAAPRCFRSSRIRLIGAYTSEKNPASMKEMRKSVSCQRTAALTQAIAMVDAPAST